MLKTPVFQYFPFRAIFNPLFSGAQFQMFQGIRVSPSSFPPTKHSSFLTRFLHLEPQTTIYKWMFGETTIFYIKIWNHPTETSMYKWLFRVPGTPKTGSTSSGDGTVTSLLRTITPEIIHLVDLTETLPVTTWVRREKPRLGFENNGREKPTPKIGREVMKKQLNIWEILRKNSWGFFGNGKIELGPGTLNNHLYMDVSVGWFQIFI